MRQPRSIRITPPPPMALGRGTGEPSHYRLSRRADDVSLTFTMLILWSRYVFVSGVLPLRKRKEAENRLKKFLKKFRRRLKRAVFGAFRDDLAVSLHIPITSSGFASEKQVRGSPHPPPQSLWQMQQEARFALRIAHRLAFPQTLASRGSSAARAMGS